MVKFFFSSLVFLSAQKTFNQNFIQVRSFVNVLGLTYFLHLVSFTASLNRMQTRIKRHFRELDRLLVTPTIVKSISAWGPSLSPKRSSPKSRRSVLTNSEANQAAISKCYFCQMCDAQVDAAWKENEEKNLNSLIIHQEMKFFLWQMFFLHFE